jgi:hypothetical protein
MVFKCNKAWNLLRVPDATDKTWVKDALRMYTVVARAVSPLTPHKYDSRLAKSQSFQKFSYRIMPLQTQSQLPVPLPV